MIKRASLYLRRKYKRTILLLVLLFVLAFSLAVGLSMWGSVNAAAQDVERRLGTSFIVKMQDGLTAGPFEMVKLRDGGERQVYVGPRVDQQMVDQIMQQVDGISSYEADNYTFACVDGIKLIEGGYASALADELERMREDPEWDEKRPDQMLDDEEYRLMTRMTTVYASSNTELFSYFRTGAFTLIEGRHVTSQDSHKVIISDRFAEVNNLELGDTFTLQMQAGFERVAVGECKVEIVGIFQVNGYQPINELVFESHITYNWIFTDIETFADLQSISDQYSYLDYKWPLYYDNVTFFVEDADQLEEIIAEVQDLDVMDSLYFTVVRDDTMYKSTVEPLNSIKTLVLVAVSAIAIGCFVVLCIVFTMWIRSRRREIAIYLSLGIRKAEILGQFIIEAAVVAVAASVVAFAVCQPVADAIGNSMLSTAVAEAAPEEKVYSEEELYELAVSGDTTEEFALDSGTYAGPEYIDFQFGLAEMLILVAAEFLIIIAAICKGGSFIFKLQPRQIMTTLS